MYDDIRETVCGRMRDDHMGLGIRRLETLRADKSKVVEKSGTNFLFSASNSLTLYCTKYIKIGYV